MTVVRVEIENLDDIGVSQRGHVLRLAPEASQEVLLFRHEGVQDLDSHVAVKAGLERLVDLGHAPAAQPGDDPIFAQVPSDEILRHPSRSSPVEFDSAR